MRAFALYLNGKKISTAGIGADGVLSANITWVSGKGPTSPKRRVASEQIGVALGGLNTETDEHLRWSQRPLRVGDEVCIKVIETDDSVDKPRHRQRRNRTQELRQQKTYVRQMAKTFGWKILLPR